jgi:serine protease Do
MKKYFLFLILLPLISFSSLAQKKEMPSLKFGDPLPGNAFVELAKLVNPAVVNISTTAIPQRGYPGSRGPRDPFFDMLEELYGLRMQQQQPPSKSMPHSLGTGFIIREDGLIVTNNHVIAGADKIMVQINENSDKTYEAKVVGSDDRTDIALIKIEGKGFPTLAMGSSKSTEVGEWVGAFGNPFGQGHTMTKGIISAKERAIDELNRFPLLQTDAPINPGNSGGPLVNLKGQAIGVNSAIDPRAQGIGFAIPIDEVKSILPLLEKNGRIRKGYLGVTPMDLDPRIAMELGIKETEGAVIAQVEGGSPASKAGFKLYDVVTEFNSKKITSAGDLFRAVGDAPTGESVKAKVLREGKSVTLTVAVGERPELPAATPSRRGENLGQKHELGFQVADATDKLRKEFRLEPDVRKPLIVNVSPKSPAAQSGLLVGDVVLDVNRKEVNSASDVLKNLKKGTNTLRIFRQGAILLLALRN